MDHHLLIFTNDGGDPVKVDVPDYQAAALVSQLTHPDTVLEFKASGGSRWLIPVRNVAAIRDATDDQAERN